MSAYREPGREVDLTEIERAKIHEAAETKRKTVEEREKTRRAAIENRDTGGYVLTRLGFAAAFIALVIGTYCAVASYFESKAERTCHDESKSKGTYASITCTHPLHVLVESDKERACRCGVARLP